MSRASALLEDIDDYRRMIDQRRRLNPRAWSGSYDPEYLAQTHAFFHEVMAHLSPEERDLLRYHPEFLEDDTITSWDVPPEMRQVYVQNAVLRIKHAILSRGYPSPRRSSSLLNPRSWRTD